MSKIYDVIFLGAGPAGLAAGLYAGRSRLSVLIIEKGQRHQCFYDTGYGTMMLGISGDDITSCLNDSGGHLQVRYTLDVNASMASENELQVDVEEYYPS